MIHAFEVNLDTGHPVEIFVSRVDHDLRRQLGRILDNGWLVSIPKWNWSAFVKEETESLDDARFWISKLASAYTDDDEGIYRVAEELAKRC